MIHQELGFRSQFRRHRTVLFLLGLGVIAFVCLRKVNSLESKYITRIERFSGNVSRERRFPNMIAELLPSFVAEGRIVGLYMEDREPDESEIKEWLVTFPNLRRISLWNSQTSDGLVDQILNHRELQFLWLCKTSVSDRGIAKLSELDSLSGLYLDDTPITDEAIASLAALPNLYRLSCANTPITDDSVDDLLRMPDLGELDVTGTQISETGLQRLRSKSILLRPGLAGAFPLRILQR